MSTPVIGSLPCTVSSSALASDLVRGLAGMGCADFRGSGSLHRSLRWSAEVLCCIRGGLSKEVPPAVRMRIQLLATRWPKRGGRLDKYQDAPKKQRRHHSEKLSSKHRWFRRVQFGPCPLWLWFQIVKSLGPSFWIGRELLLYIFSCFKRPLHEIAPFRRPSRHLFYHPDQNHFKLIFCLSGWAKKIYWCRSGSPKT